MKRYIGVLCAACMACPGILPLRGAEREGVPEIRAAVAPEKATIGVPLEYRVTVAGTKLKGLKIALPESKMYFPPKTETAKSGKPGGDTTPEAKVPLYIIQSTRREDNSSGDVTHQTAVVKLAYYRPGTHRLPELNIFMGSDERIGYQIPMITIESVNPGGEFQEIEPPLSLGGNYYRLVMVILGAMALGAGIYFLVRFLAARRKLREVPDMPVPPLEIFMREAGELARKRYIESGQTEEFVVGISHCFRKFISGQFHFDAMDMTGTEMNSALKRALPPEKYAPLAGDLESMVNLWDLAKFAEFAPSPETLGANLDMTIKVARKLSVAEGEHGN